ncbi:MAG TPA: protein kinase [Pyrinomonadaceae bacterium]|nr:protein kinase [Pyrinomonadaceae bacterium]
MLSPNTRIGRYEIRSLLGKGGMGEVHLAYDTQLRRQVAIKLLPPEFTWNKGRLQRFEREAYAASSLNHPYILTIYEIGELDGQHFIATEYIEGESLRRHLTDPRMELREVLDVAQQVASALSAAHQAGIVHRDVKPENIMVRRDGFIKVLDFGLAKLTDEAAAEEADPEAATRTRVVHTEPGMVMGTASYMSPEQARGLEVDARSDLWSLGVVLYEMVAGRLPFEGATNSDVIAMVLHREPPSLLHLRRDVPAELERIVEKALTKERDERYQLAKDIGLDLKRLRQHLELEAELERSITPEEAAQRTGGLVVTTRGEAAAISGTATNAPTTEANAAHAVSSAEYVVGEIKRHKLGAALVLASLVIATALAAFAYYSSLGDRSAAINSVAVLPFANLSGDPNMEYLSDGLSESLINNLSQLPSLKVISRNSAFKYKGQEIDPQEVARSLGVQGIVTGRVVQRGDQLQVSAELVDVRDKTQMWGEQFNRPATDLLQVQAEISQHIAEKLRHRLTSADQQQLVKEAKANPQAYELVLKGRFHTAKAGQEGLKKALEYYHQAVAVDPNYALAHALLASTYHSLGGNSILDPKEAMPKAEAAAKKALELDESLAEAHSALALIKSDAWDWVEAEREFKRAIELNPSLATAHTGYGYYLSCMGRHEEAIAEAKRAKELDPLRLGSNAYVGYALSDARQYDRAIEEFKKTLELDQNFSLARFLLGYTYAAKGQHAQAIAEYQETEKLMGEGTNLQCYLGYALAKGGRREEAEAILKQLETTRAYVSPAELAVLYVGLGQKEQALSALERAYAAHDVQMKNLGVDPHYDSLRAEPRFQDLMRKVGLHAVKIQLSLKARIATLTVMALSPKTRLGRYEVRSQLGKGEHG